MICLRCRFSVCYKRGSISSIPVSPGATVVPISFGPRSCLVVRCTVALLQLYFLIAFGLVAAFEGLARARRSSLLLSNLDLAFDSWDYLVVI